MDDYSGIDDETWPMLMVVPWHLRHGRAGHELLLACRHALPGFHPLDESDLGIADGPRRDLDVGRPVAAHALLCEPGNAHLQKFGRFLGGQHDWKSGRQFLGRRIALSGRFRIHKMDTFVERRSELRLTGLHPYSSK